MDTDLPTTTPPSADQQAAATPDDVLAWLQAGTERFSSGRSTQRDLLAQARATAGAQHPVAAILGCKDSRVPPELVFDLGIGDAFVTRTAGNVIDGTILGGLEFATAVVGAKVIVVLGHSSCGAVMGACDGVQLGNLTELLAKITPAVEEASGGDTTPGSGDAGLVQRAVEANVRNVVAQIPRDSSVIRELVEAGDVAIVGAVYDLAAARVTWLDPA